MSHRGRWILLIAIATAVFVRGVRTSLAAVQTRTAVIRLDQGQTTSLSGLNFISLTSAVEVTRNGPQFIDGQPLVQGTDYTLDPNDGTLALAPGRAALWGRFTWTFEDHAEAEAAAQAEAVAAAADCGIQLPALRARIIQDLADLDQEEARAQQIQDQMTAQLAAFAADPTLPASPTAAQLRSAIVTLSARDQEAVAALRDAALGAKRNISRTRGLARLIACQAGIDLP